MTDYQTNVKIGIVHLPLSQFFRQGQKDQIKSLILPVYGPSSLSGEEVFDEKIGEISLIILNKVDQTSLKSKERFLAKTNNYKDLEFFKNNSEIKTEKRKKRILVPKKCPN